MPDERNRDSREVEWQMASADLAAVRRWLAEHGTIDGLQVEPRPTLKLRDTYFDTDDWRIHRAGYALRIRAESGKSEATLKSLHSASEEVADRRELSEPLEGPSENSIAQSGGPVGARVQAVTGAHRLQPLFEVNTSRQRFAISDEHRQLGEIALDETVVSRPQGEPRATTQRVEVEALGEEHEPLEKLVKVLRSECALEPVADTKYSLGLRSVGLAPTPAPEFSPTTIDASMRIDEVARANLRRYLSAWLTHEPGARLGDDIEQLHGLRVAGRRLDALLGLFEPYLPESLVRIRRTFKKLLRILGKARDFDIALLELQSFSRELPDSEREGVEPLRRYLELQRTRARARMLRALDSVATQRDIERLTRALAQPATETAPPTSELAVLVAPQLIRERYKKVRKGARRLTAHSSMEEYHAVRGRVKKLRYALEAVGVIYGKPADEMLRAIRRLQEKLGIQQDAHVARGRLLALAASPPRGTAPETLFLMGRLAERHAAAAARTRKRLGKAYRKVQGRRWKTLRTKLEQPPASRAVSLQPRSPAI